MAYLSTLWKLENGVLTLEVPVKQAYFTISQDRHIEAYRGDLPLPEFLHYLDKFMSVYREML